MTELELNMFPQYNIRHTLIMFDGIQIIFFLLFISAAVNN